MKGIMPRATKPILLMAAGMLVAASPLSAAPLSAPAVPAGAAGQVNIYSYRQPFLLKPFLDEFTRRTGIKVNVVFARKGVLQRLKAEGRNTPADLVMTTDVSRLTALANAELLSPVRSPILEKNIPARYRHPDGLWFGLTTRARVVFAHKDRVKPGEIRSYEDLTDVKWRGRICSRSGKHAYNISLLASIIVKKGEKAAEEWALGIKKNLARRPQGNDRSQIKAIHEGLCDVALGNTYYMGAMATNEKKPRQKEWAKSVRIDFPKVGGTHVNISGAAITAHAKNRSNALKLLEFLSGDLAQKMYAASNFEYPVKPGVAWHPMVEAWGRFTADEINLAELAKNRIAAAKIMDRVGFDN